MREAYVQPERGIVQRAVAIVTLSAALLLSADGPNESYTLPPTPSTTAESSEAVLRSLPGPVCVRPAETDAARKVRERTRRCQQAQTTGRIALVGFGIEPNLLDRISQGVQKGLPISTAGAITASVEAMPASAKATTLFSREIMGDCIDGADELAAPKAADKAMHLKKDSMVVGLSSLRLCTSGFKGLAEVPGRHAGVFDVKESDEDSVRVDINAAIHEILHLYGLGHAGSMERDDYTWMVHASEPDSVLDLDRYLANCKYNEYDSSSVMGYATASSPASILLDAPQRNSLTWPNVVLGDKNASPLHKAVNGQFEITASQAANGHFGVVKLDESVSFKYGDKHEKTFDGIAFVPEIGMFGEEDGQRKTYVAGAKIFLVSDGGATTAMLGTVESFGLYSGTQTRIYRLGSQQLELSFDGSGLKVSVSAA